MNAEISNQKEYLLRINKIHQVLLLNDQEDNVKLIEVQHTPHILVTTCIHI